ncbi:hypothetical protein Tco_0636076 [Tanacetum coccineum]
MDSFQGLTSKSPSSWHRSLAPSTNILRPHRLHPEKDNGLRRRRLTKEEERREHRPQNPNIDQLLGVMESHVNTLMKDAILIMERSENIFGISTDMMPQLPLEPLHQEAFEDLVMNFILDQEEKVKQLEEYMGVIGSNFM